MTDKRFLLANDDTAAASTHPVRSEERVRVTPFKQTQKTSQLHCGNVNKWWGETEGRGRREISRNRTTPRANSVSRAEPEGSTSSAERKSKSHSRPVPSRWSPEGRRKTEVDQGQIGSPLTIIPTDNTVRNWAHSAARENSRVTWEHERGWRDEWRTGEKVSNRSDRKEKNL